MFWFSEDTLVICPICEAVTEAGEWAANGRTCGDGCCSEITDVWCPECGQVTDPIDVKEQL